jgi:putative ABC transport system permease protein
MIWKGYRIHGAVLKDTFREIIRKPSRFISIFAIIAIGVSFFVGLKSTCPDMKLTADAYFKSTRLMDMCVVSELGLEEEDIAAFCAVPGVSNVMPSYSAEAFLEYKGSSTVVKVHALPAAYAGYQALNEPTLLAGRLPQASGECVVENGIGKSMQFKVGDSVALHPGAEDEDLPFFSPLSGGWSEDQAPGFLHPDRLHPTEEGYAVMGSRLVEELAALELRAVERP